MTNLEIVGGKMKVPELKGNIKKGTKIVLKENGSILTLEKDARIGDTEIIVDVNSMVSQGNNLQGGALVDFLYNVGGQKLNENELYVDLAQPMQIGDDEIIILPAIRSFASGQLFEFNGRDGESIFVTTRTFTPKNATTIKINPSDTPIALSGQYVSKDTLIAAKNSNPEKLRFLNPSMLIPVGSIYVVRSQWVRTERIARPIQEQEGLFEYIFPAEEDFEFRNINTIITGNSSFNSNWLRARINSERDGRERAAFYLNNSSLSVTESIFIANAHNQFVEASVERVFVFGSRSGGSNSFHSIERLVINNNPATSVPTYTAPNPIRGLFRPIRMGNALANAGLFTQEVRTGLFLYPLNAGLDLNDEVIVTPNVGIEDNNIPPAASGPIQITFGAILRFNISLPAIRTWNITLNQSVQSVTVLIEGSEVAGTGSGTTWTFTSSVSMEDNDLFYYFNGDKSINARGKMFINQVIFSNQSITPPTNSVVTKGESLLTTITYDFPTPHTPQVLVNNAIIGSVSRVISGNTNTLTFRYTPNDLNTIRVRTQVGDVWTSSEEFFHKGDPNVPNSTGGQTDGEQTTIPSIEIKSFTPRTARISNVGGGSVSFTVELWGAQAQFATDLILYIENQDNGNHVDVVMNKKDATTWTGTAFLTEGSYIADIYYSFQGSANLSFNNRYAITIAVDEGDKDREGKIESYE